MTRAKCVDIVWRVARSRCERCGLPLRRDDGEGEVNERVPRSRGGDPNDPDNCELLCSYCHRPNGAHAPTRERLARLLDGKVFLG